MKSYLHRMAASTLSRERSVHPVLGTLWAPQRSADAFELSGETIMPGAKPQRTQDAEQTQTPVQPQMQAHLLVQPTRVDSLHIESEQSSAFMPQTRAEAGMPMHSSSEAQRIHAISALARATSPTEGNGELPPAGSEPQRRNFKPLVPESSEQAQASQNAAVPAVAAPRVDSLRRQPVAQPAREPDTIEIHIGRIEVLAAQPQQVQRPPAQPARKSLDLGEYLRRGGRAQ
jgi:hypothetical protein